MIMRGGEGGGSKHFNTNAWVRHNGAVDLKMKWGEWGGGGIYSKLILEPKKMLKEV